MDTLSHTSISSSSTLAIADTTKHHPRSSEETASWIDVSCTSGEFKPNTVTVGIGAPRASAPRQLSNDVNSTRGGSPYSQSVNSSYILAAPSWSAVAEEDLLCNLGQRERARQEVLWEIVRSEERYVAELTKMKEAFIDPLLHPYFSVATPALPTFRETTASFPTGELFLHQASHTESLEKLPIASRFLTTSANRPSNTVSEMPCINDDSSGDNAHPRLSIDNFGACTVSSGIQIGLDVVLQGIGPGDDPILESIVSPHLLPAELRKCLEVMEEGIIKNHETLMQALRSRYEVQYPLVRSLADIFVANSHILNGYAAYILDLEQALVQVDNALAVDASAKSSSEDAFKISNCLQRLEAVATENGETGLAISLSRPFQRLLKYPLLFQNLLFHTDPSTFEYESTLQMVAEIESIVGSIEDKKIQKEERDKTRDVFARIDGLEQEKALVVPKPSRVLIEERCMDSIPYSSASSPGSSSRGSPGIKGKSSFKRLSDVLQANSSIFGKKDVWLIIFNDVVIRCQRTGVTSLPLGAGLNSKTISIPGLQERTKYAATGRRVQQANPRNLYKYLSVESWKINDILAKTDDLSVNNDEEGLPANASPEPIPEEEDVDSDDSDLKSKMSFSYWGADKITVNKPAIKKRMPLRGGRRGSPLGLAAYGRESSANAKFGSRLVSDNSLPVSPAHIHPPSRRALNPAHSLSNTQSRTTTDSRITLVRPSSPKPNTHE